MRPAEAWLSYLSLGVAWMILAAFMFASHRASAIADLEVAASFWLAAILLSLGMKRRDAVLIALTFLAGAAGIDWALGIF